MAAATPATPEDARRKRVLVVVFLTIFIDLVGFSIVFPLFPSMMAYYLPREQAGGVFSTLLGVLQDWSRVGGNESGAFYVQVLFGGVLGSLYSVLQFLFAPIWGRLSDRHGRRAILLITTTGTALSYLLWVFSGSFLMLLAARIVGGIMSGNLSVATAAVADVTSARKRAGGMAIVGVAFGLGFIFGPAIGGLSAQVDLSSLAPSLASFGINPFSGPALIALALAALNVFWVARRFEETKPGEAGAPAPAPRPSRLRDVFVTANAPLRRAILVYLLFMLSFSGAEFTLTFLAAERLHYTAEQNVFIFLFVGFVLIGVQGGLVRRLAPVLGEKPLAVVGLLAGFLALGLLGMSQGVSTFYGGLALLGLGIGLVSPTLSALASLYSGADVQGGALGTFRSAGSLARAIGPLAAASVFWRFGSQFAYLSAMLLMTLPLLLALTLPEPPATEKAPESAHP